MDTREFAAQFHAVLLERGVDDWDDQIHLEVEGAMGRVVLNDYFTPMQATYNDTADTPHWQQIETRQSIPDAHRAFYAAGNTPVLSLKISDEPHGRITILTPAHIRERGFLGFLIRDLEPAQKILTEVIFANNAGVIPAAHKEDELIEALEALRSAPLVDLSEED